MAIVISSASEFAALFTSGFSSETRYILTAAAREENADILSAELLNTVWGEVDRNRSWVKYAPVVAVDDVIQPDFANARTFWADELEVFG